ncbi:MAG: hypothetical protein HON76_09380 [Candidatus Scalindua sp.]|jgi:deoxyinosine 3'endonuclease (endonuclease V)|nr:hypothetical protein [Candidatus Scalindua sp.]MBT5306897.1 hypothetical protein [Candidatus Scalindua sp.]MBT6046381.1 hypothetical protein [Candidatus Scalindua sp.]MBT6228281.1 hypothetical protein [Candidatus Scalindua sp.]MBT6562727.1 hypothetical protein [Candidatus Scalindua sp.]
MKHLKRHPWNVKYKKAVEIQRRLKRSIVLKCTSKNFKYIAGADVSYLPERAIKSTLTIMSLQERLAGAVRQVLKKARYFMQV